MDPRNDEDKDEGSHKPPRPSEFHVLKEAPKNTSVCQDLVEYFQRQTQKLFEKSLPIEYLQLLEPSNKWIFGSVLHFVIVAAIGIMFATLYWSNQETVYLSPLQQESNCSPVDRPLTGTFYGDLDGSWSGTNQYSPTLAVYKIQFNNFTAYVDGNHMTLTQRYQDLMVSVKDILLNLIKPVMMKQNLAMNLLYFMLWSATAKTGAAFNEQSFSFTGSPLAVFEALDYADTGIASSLGQCRVIPDTQFDPGSQSWIISWNYNAYVADPACSESLPPNFLGHVEGREKMTIKIDSRAFFAAVAANHPSEGDWKGYDKMQLSHYPMQDVVNGGFNHTFGTPPRPYLVTRKYTDRYPGMNAFWCIEQISESSDHDPSSDPLIRFCFIKVGGIFAYPLFNHFGKRDFLRKNNSDSQQEPIPCECSDLPSPVPHFSNCNNFDFLHGLLFFKADLSNFNFTAMTEFLLAVPNTNENSIIDRAFVASWSTPPHILNPGSAATFQFANMSALDRRRAFSFCDTSLGGCTLLMTRSTNDNRAFPAAYKATPFYFMFEDAACNFNLMSPTFHQLIDISPVSFQESYWTCKPSRVQSFGYALGLSLANAKVIIPAVAFLFINLLLLWQWFSGRSLPIAYSEAEKDAVLGTFAKRVLLYRNQKSRFEDEADLCQYIESPLASSPYRASCNDAPAGLRVLQPTLLAVARELCYEMGPEGQAPPEIFIERENKANAPLPRLQSALGINFAKISKKILGSRNTPEAPQGVEIGNVVATPLALSVDSPLKESNTEDPIPAGVPAARNATRLHRL